MYARLEREKSLFWLCCSTERMETGKEYHPKENVCANLFFWVFLGIEHNNNGGKTVKKGTLLNGPISRVISLLGHGDAICIGDAGLPIPEDVERIDLAVTHGMPPFLATVEAIVAELCVERVVLATEFALTKSEVHTDLLKMFSSLESAQGNTITIDECSHEEFKERTRNCRAVIRTGECTPYANVILHAGVTF
jgi:D-ribose pyranase